VRPTRLLLAAAAVALAAAAVLLARDVRSWEEAVAAGDAELTRSSREADWGADARLPGDPAHRLLGVEDDLDVRRALQAFVVAERTPRGFDSGEGRARARSAAEALLGDVAVSRGGATASQAENLVGILVHRTGRVADGTTGEDRAIAAFETAVRLDPRNTDAKFNLELMLSRARATGTREGPGAGSGPRGPGRRGAGAGTAGRGY
jgi:hypothetical protein